ncbi:MAG TPA: SGNH/GDSL hydrolase family protein [Sporichthyaceae bacterium]|nr:SGNH/GDSL hydrolase family protein [Sporichthyaceae bacterium]
MYEQGWSARTRRVAGRATSVAAIALALSSCGSGGSGDATLNAAVPAAPVVTPAATETPSATPAATETATETPPHAAAEAPAPTHPTEASAPKPTPTPKPSYPPGGNIVAFGDSVPAGVHCSCTNFVDYYANLVTEKVQKKYTTDNFAVSGSRSGDVVNLLAQAKVQSALKTATTVLIMTGANDYNDAFDQASLGADFSKLYPNVATAVQDNVTTAVQKIQALNAAAHVVVLDYWASMEDGAVASKDYDKTAMTASLACTASTNAALALAAKATNATYVSTLTAFKGSKGTKDDTDLLASDGDHPDAAGHALIARTIAAVFPKG